MARIPRLLLLLTALAGMTAPAAGAADQYLGTWNIDPGAPGNPWASGDDVFTLSPATKAEIQAFDDKLAEPGRTNLHRDCLGTPGEPAPFDQAATVFYTATYTWKGGGVMKGCLTVKGAGHRPQARVLYGSGNVSGELTSAKDDKLTGVWGDKGDGSGPFFTGVREQPTVALGDLKGKVEVSRVEAAWEPAVAGSTLKKGDKIHTGFKAGVTLTFADGSTLRVEPMTLIELDEVSRGAGGRTKLKLKAGKIEAQVNRMPGARGDFDVKTPTTTASVRGTKFVVFYDGSATVVAVTQSSVAVRANSGRQVVVPAGKEATSTAKRVSKPVKVGHGERRGGVTAETAFDRLGAHLAVGLKRCGFDVVSGQLDPAPGGWSGSFVIVAAGDGVGDKTKGTAIFGLKGTRFRAANDLAKQILAGCR